MQRKFNKTSKQLCLHTQATEKTGGPRERKISGHRSQQPSMFTPCEMFASDLRALYEGGCGGVKCDVNR